MTDTTPPPKIVRADHTDGSDSAMLADQWMLYGEDTGGALSFARSIVGPGEGPPLHVHCREDETYYVLTGRLEVTIDDQREVLDVGDCVFLPRGIPHGLRNPGPEPAQILMLIHPPGLEYFFEEMARLRSQGEPSREALSELAARYF